ncbi:hypothetical protein [Hydrogenophaga sp. PAMC20947]|uniref:hypothetical protein n=1 Tax=Hydrogenophaga sp. PAMC20947 TaxID=2565558 RepID=UPI00109DA2F4|nr:hypothetical protein [Hydrogenophaga sp. PAMC20947]QCB45303.1 hypothetical protein E5678_04235 [Hydrogenophaga sp. PAMC20947]
MDTAKSSDGNLTIKARTLPGAATFAMARQGIAQEPESRGHFDGLSMKEKLASSSQPGRRREIAASGPDLAHLLRHPRERHLQRRRGQKLETRHPDRRPLHDPGQG